MTQTNERFVLRRWVGPYAHMPLVFVPFVVVFAMVGLALWMDELGNESATWVLMGVAQVGFVVAVFGLPFAWRRWREAGTMELGIDDGAVRFGPPGGPPRWTVDRDALSFRYGHFRYFVPNRWGGGLLRGPCVTLQAGGARVTIGAEQTLARTVSGVADPKPAFVLGPVDWARLERALGVPESERASRGGG